MARQKLTIYIPELTGDAAADLARIDAAVARIEASEYPCEAKRITLETLEADRQEVLSGYKSRAEA